MLIISTLIYAAKSKTRKTEHSYEEYNPIHVKFPPRFPFGAWKKMNIKDYQYYKKVEEWQQTEWVHCWSNALAYLF